MNVINFLKPIMAMFCLAAFGTFALMAGAAYMECPIDSVVIVTSFFIIFAIYAINRFTDKEDLINDINKRQFFEDNPIILVLSILLLLSSVIALHIYNKLTVFHIAIIIAGIAYSCNIIPVLSKGKHLSFKRIKDIPFAKSATVSMIWGTYFFAISWSLYPNHVQNPLDIILFIISSTIAIFVNTNFADIRDHDGDLAYNVPTLPVIFGVKNTFVYALLLPSIIWLCTIVALTITGTIMVPTLVFMLINLFFPLIYILGYYKKIISKSLIEPFSDSYIAVFGAGLFALSFIA